MRRWQWRWSAILVAFRQANASYVVAARELSIAVAVALGVAVLKEPLTTAKALSTAAIVVGVILVKVACAAAGYNGMPKEEKTMPGKNRSGNDPCAWPDRGRVPEGDSNWHPCFVSSQETEGSLAGTQARSVPACAQARATGRAQVPWTAP